MTASAPPSILILGARGQVGWELQRALAPVGPVTALGRAECDAADPHAVRDAIAAARPAVIVNAAAYTAVDKAELDEAAAHRVNAELPAWLADAARAHGAWLVHYSTDYVFDGASPGRYAEDAPTAPQSVYGRTKLAGEAPVRAWERHLLFRTSWVFGIHGGNFAKTMLRLAATRDALNVVDDQTGAPTSAALIADVTAHALRAVLAGRGAPGLYHLASAGETTWCGYARHVIAEARRLGAPLRCTPDAVTGIPTSAYPLPAARPMNSRLDTSRLRQTFDLDLPPWQPQVTRLLEAILLNRESHA